MSDEQPRREGATARYVRDYPEKELADLMLDLIQTNLAASSGLPLLDLTEDHERWRGSLGRRR